MNRGICGVDYGGEFRMEGNVMGEVVDGRQLIIPTHWLTVDLD